MRITHYRTVSATHAGLLDEVVNELIGQGYQPYGNPYAAGRMGGQVKKFNLLPDKQ